MGGLTKRIEAMPDWLAVMLAVLAPVLSFVATLLAMAMTYGRRVGTVETTLAAHTKILEELPAALRALATKEDVVRLEKADAECEGRMASNRQESSDRVERLSNRLAAHEQNTGAQNSSVTSAIAEFRATMAAMKESIDRLEAAERHAERQRAAGPPLDIIGILNLAAQAAPLVRQLMDATPSKRAHA